MSRNDEYYWVRLNFVMPDSENTWKLVRGRNDPTNYGMLSKWARHWVVSIYTTGEIVAELPRTLNTDDAKSAAKLLLLSLKEKE